MTDFFYSSEMLRYEDEMEYRTLTGGLISLAIIINILVGFANMILDTFRLNSITTTMEVVKNPIPTSALLSTAPDSQFMFAAEIWHLNLFETKRFFDVTFQLDYEEYGVLVKTTSL